MHSIRKFVGYAGAAAAVSAALAITMSTTGTASTQLKDPDDQDTSAVTQVSQPCATAIMNLKSAVITLINDERAEALNPGQPSDATADATEFAAIAKMAIAARDVCAPSQTVGTVTAPSSKPASVPNHSQNPQCAAAMQALKAAWMQGRPTTQAQWVQLATLAKAARTACGPIEG